MKILFIAPKYSGGIGGHAFRVYEKLQDYGYDIKLKKMETKNKNKLNNKIHKRVDMVIEVNARPRGDTRFVDISVKII